MIKKQPTQRRTRMFARVLGPLFAILAVVVAVRGPDMKTALSEFSASQLWPLMIGALSLLGGLAIIAFHQLWRGAAAIIISVFGWVLAVRSVLLLAFPDAVASLADRMIDFGMAWQVAYVVWGLLGLYLAYVGWKPVRYGHREDGVHISIDIQEAA